MIKVLTEIIEKEGQLDLENVQFVLIEKRILYFLVRIIFVINVLQIGNFLRFPSLKDFFYLFSLQKRESRSEECPMCREKISADESWLILEAGDSIEDISKFLYKFVDKL